MEEAFQSHERGTMSSNDPRKARNKWMSLIILPILRGSRFHPMEESGGKTHRFSWVRQGEWEHRSSLNLQNRVLKRKKKTLHKESRASKNSTSTEEYTDVEKSRKETQKVLRGSRIESHLRVKILPHKAWDSRGIQVHRNGEWLTTKWALLHSHSVNR